MSPGPHFCPRKRKAPSLLSGLQVTTCPTPAVGLRCNENGPTRVMYLIGASSWAWTGPSLALGSHQHLPLAPAGRTLRLLTEPSPALGPTPHWGPAHSAFFSSFSLQGPSPRGAFQAGARQVGWNRERALKEGSSWESPSSVAAPAGPPDQRGSPQGCRRGGTGM